MIPNLSKGMIDDMQQLRKRMRAEFGVELRLSQSDILEQIADLAARSKDHRTRMLFENLQSQVGGEISSVAQKAQDLVSEQSVNTPKQKIRVYRGCKILEETPPSTNQSVDKQRIYRGQVVA